MPDTTRTRRGRDQGLVNVAGGVCFRPGHRARLVYRQHVYHGRAGEPKTFAGRDYCDLIITVHRQLDAPLVWCRDNLSRHLTEEPADLTEANRAWLQRSNCRLVRPC
ncbi:transposase [Streptomyces sp. NPDC002144]|uniref:hypothetical protein n=1 Tax=Streptomyces sp. NPDC006668 TaxID=3156903 RepID=UPI0033E6FECE